MIRDLVINYTDRNSNGRVKMIEMTKEDLALLVQQNETAWEGLAIRVLGQEAYDNSPCQAHPGELIEAWADEAKLKAAAAQHEMEYVEEQLRQLVTLLEEYKQRRVDEIVELVLVGLPQEQADLLRKAGT